MIIRKVKSIKGNGTYENENGVDLGNGKKGYFKYEYEFEDGSFISANHKTNPSPFKVGDEVEVITKGTTKYGVHGTVSKPKENGSQTGTASAKAEVSADVWRKKDVAIIYQNALTQANTFYKEVGYQGKTADQSLQLLMDTTKIIAKFVIEESGI